VTCAAVYSDSMTAVDELADATPYIVLESHTYHDHDVAIHMHQFVLYIVFLDSVY
jgi:hypothetical protein